MKLAPIVILTYNRPWHTQQTVEALLKNEYASESDLIIFSDAPKNEAAKNQPERLSNPMLAERLVMARIVPSNKRPKWLR